MFVALQHFEGYDPEGFSMWMCDYKYNDENTVNYVVMNKVSPPAPPIWHPLAFYCLAIGCMCEAICEQMSFLALSTTSS